MNPLFLKMTRQYISESVKKIQIEALNYLKKKHTVVGKITWILNCILIIILFNLILKILLDHFGYLNDFLITISIIFQFLIGIILYDKETNFFSFMNNLPLLSHIVSFLVLISIYFISIGHIWKNKENYIKP